MPPARGARRPRPPCGRVHALGRAAASAPRGSPQHPPRVVGEQIAIRASALLVTFPAQPFNLALEIVARSASLPSVEIEPRSPHGRADALGAVVQIGRQFGTERLVRNRARHPLEFRNGPAALSIGALLAGVRAMAARSPGRRLLDVVAALGADGGFRNGSAHAAAAFARRRSRVLNHAYARRPEAVEPRYWFRFWIVG
jgi:hypothetical protein